MGAIPLSDETTVAGLTIRLWTYVIRKKTGCKVSSRLIQRTATECGIEQPMSTSIGDAITKRATAWKGYYSAASMADELREAQLDRLVEIIAEKEGDDKANVILKKKQNEEMRNSHRQIKYARKRLLVVALPSYIFWMTMAILLRPMTKLA